MDKIKLKTPYLVMLGSEKNVAYAKTGLGLAQWRKEQVLGQLRFPDCEIDLGVPDMDIKEAVKKGAISLLIGVAPVGGAIPDSWLKLIEEAAEDGLDIVNGLHLKFTENKKLVDIAKKSGARLIDVRIPPKSLPVGTGIKRFGKRLLTVGTDCASGKKYTALAIDLAMKKNGMNSTFRATGQTGIIIAGEGIPIDAVVADFISGAAELVSPNNEDNHWDVIEGQGSIFHPGYAGVSLGLLHGSQPDAFVVCHQATRKAIFGFEHIPLPSITECIDLHLTMGKLTNPNITCVGVSVNSSGLSSAERESYLNNLSKETGLPCIDPLIEGCDAIVNYINNKL